MKIEKPLYQFKNIAQKYAQKIAVCDDKRSLTYEELHTTSNQIAHILRSNGAVKGSRIGLLGPRSTWFVEGFLAILKTGATYIPLDPTYPLDRINRMILASQIEILLVDVAVESLIYDLDINEGLKKIIFLNKEESPETERQHDVDLPIEIDDADLIVILFTSGSTGMPKGVKLTYAGYRNNFENMQSLLHFNHQTKIAHMASPCFDISITELWLPLLFGATIYVASDEIKKNPWLLAEWIQKNAIDTIQFVPSLFHHFLLAHEDAPCRFPSIHNLLFIGEALRSSLIKQWFESYGESHCHVYNLYGPVEASIEVSSYVVDHSTELFTDTVPIGKPFKGVDFHIIGADNEWIFAPGEEGMLFIGGIQLAAGYLDSEQTNKAFKSSSQGCIYETGDIVERLPSGDFLYRGRKDRQVKIRGYRIEMVEIEEALITCSGIKHSAVIAQSTTDGVHKLIGFITGKPSSIEQINSELSAKLPGYMIPQKIIFINELPLNSNGKTDYKALQTYV